MPANIRSFLQNQVQKALKYGREIVEEPGLSDLPNQIRKFWTGGQSLLECSTILATNLQSNQPAISPEGLLMVADVFVDQQQRVFVVAKLEHETGARARLKENERGELVFDMQFLDDLFFTRNSRVYKIGYFPIGSDPSATLSGLVVDRQAQGHEVAHYFRANYLGCTWKEQPELVTERFLHVVQKWINSVNDPEKRARYTVALIAELQGAGDSLSIDRFAAIHLDVGDQDPFRRVASETLPSTEFSKDNKLVQSRISNVRLDTARGVMIVAPPDLLQDGTVTVEDETGHGAADSRIVIHDRVEKTAGSGKITKQPR